MNDSKLSKKEYAQQWLKQHSVEQWSQCIHCGQSLRLGNYSLYCNNGHQFDSAKQGYYYLTTKQLTATKYDKHLFNARRSIIMNSPFYDALHQYLKNFFDTLTDGIVIDAGSGEGSHLAKIIDKKTSLITALAFDLSKEGIQLSTQYNSTIFSAVSDLANLPIKNQMVDIILSILSPANYQEFQRILKPTGKVIKIIPNNDYLKEIREGLSIYGINDKQEYDNQQVIAVFAKNFPKFQAHRIVERVDLNDLQKAYVLEMTPLAWNLSIEQRKHLLAYLSNKITLDVTILVSQ